MLPNGQIFNTISNGRNTMRGYASQIPVDDRWAIVLYVRALIILMSLLASPLQTGYFATSYRVLEVFVSVPLKSVWVLFDMFIGLIQALIFSLLTVVYLSAAVSEEGH